MFHVNTESHVCSKLSVSFQMHQYLTITLWFPQTLPPMMHNGIFSSISRMVTSEKNASHIASSKFQGQFSPDCVIILIYFRELSWSLYSSPDYLCHFLCHHWYLFSNCLDISSLGPLRHIQRQDWSTFYESDALTCQKKPYSISLITYQQFTRYWKGNGLGKRRSICTTRYSAE